MTYSINTFNPHSFIVFMSLAMGISYVFFNSRSLFSLGKVLAILILILPMAAIGFSRGHLIDLSIGTVLGFVVARRGMLTPYWVSDHWERWIRRRAADGSGADKSTREQPNNHDDAESAFQQRKEQARQGREQPNQSNKKQGASDETYSRNTQYDKKQESQDQQKSNNQNKGPSTQPKSQLEQDYETLGITEFSSQEEAKTVLRRLRKRYHTDPLAHLPKVHIKISEDELKKVNTAWDRICRQRKWK